MASMQPAPKGGRVAIGLQLAGTGQSLVEFIRQSPLFDADDIDLRRDTGLTREVAP